MDYSIYGINGPIVKILGKTDLFLHETVNVGNEGLVGEVTSVNSSETVIQVYENTTDSARASLFTETARRCRQLSVRDFSRVYTTVSADR